MSISAILGAGAFQTGAMQGNFQNVRSDFQQIGQDLQSGNLSQAQADFATLQKDVPQGQQSTNSTLSNDLNSLSQALQSGNLTQAQQAFSTMQTDLQSAGQAHHHHHHHHHAEGQESGGSSAVSQDLMQLGQDLKSGDMSGAQSMFSTLQKDLQSYQDNSLTLATGNASTAAATSLSVSA